MSEVSQDVKHTLFLIDISSFIFRAFYAIRTMSNKQGEPTNAVYGVATMLQKLLEQAQPEYVLIAFDSKGPSFREEIYEEYKANRSEPPDLLIPQFDMINHLIDALKIPSVRQSGFEADDIIATATKKWLAESPQNQVVVVTGDKDLMQLVDGRVKIWDTMTNTLYNSDKVLEKYGVKPDQIRDYLGLVGDSSDNIPGVPSIGPKTAIGLLQEHGSLEGVLQAAADGKVAGKKGEVLKTHAKDARLSAVLATLKDDVPMDLGREQARYQFKVNEECERLLHSLDFQSLLDRWSKYRVGSAGSATSAPEAKISSESKDRFRAIQTESQFKELLKGIERVREFGFDLETTSLNPRLAKIVGVAICFDPEFGCYLPIGHAEGEQLSAKQVLSALKPYLEDPKYKKVGQNLKYDWGVLAEHGILADGIGADTMVASYVLEPEGRHNLETIAAKYLGYTVQTYEQVCGKGKDQIGFETLSIEAATRYSAEDAWVCVQLWRVMQPRLLSDGLIDVFAQVDLPLVPVLMRMEAQGVHIDAEYLGELSREFQKELEQIQERISAFTKEPVNLNSPKQLAQLLFEDLKLPPQGKTKTGYSTDASVLDALAPLHEVPRLLLEYREISKLKGTYVDPLPELRDPKSGKIHASFHQTVAATGRLSSSDPNLQNIPIRSKRGIRVRKAFIPSPGNVFVSADYSQIELRLLAHMSKDVELTKSFLAGEDVHARTAGEIYEIDPKQVTEQQRAVAKAINFGLMYGKTAFGLAQELKISRREAQDTIDRYFQRYQGVKKLLDRLIVEAKEKGYVATLMGRKRRLADIHSKNPALRAVAERMAMNTPIQGTASDLIKLAMIELDHELSAQGFKAKMIIQVHDEILIDCPKSEAEAVRKLLAKIMEGAMKLSVPLVVNTSVGVNWMEL